MAREWIWYPEWTAADQENPTVVYFRKIFTIYQMPDQMKIHISADSRYKLYVNGLLAEIGPCKGDDQVWFVDEVDLAPYLEEGKNVLAVAVLRYPLETAKGSLSIYRTDFPGLYVQGEGVSADETWKCKKASGIHFLPDSPIMSHLYIQEQVTANPALLNWQNVRYNDEEWDNAKPRGLELLTLFAKSPMHLLPRPIPSMKKIPRRFAGIQEIRQSTNAKAEWERMLAAQGSIVIPPRTEEIVELNAGELMTGFLKLVLCGGKGTEIKLLTAESYYQPADTDQWVKKDRTDSVHGQLQGLTDVYTVAGNGTNELPEIYEPFWFRTFRFIRLEITTQDAPMCICSVNYLETGYPLEIKTRVKTSDASMDGIWDISQRSLLRCMHETYMDCPFYEQLQYAMNSRAQILYTYAISADDRLARRCIHDFNRCQRYDGMIACSYPMVSYSVIPGFSIYYILMIHDHMMYFGDRELVREYLPSVDKVLNFFHRNLNENGLVGKLGGRLFRDENWSFIDWAAQWDETSGMPPAGLNGPITMESLLYVYGLEHGAELAAFANRNDVAREYKERAESVRQGIRDFCTGSDGMLQDGPGVEQYSQHCQVFGLLTDTLDPKQGAENIKKTLDNADSYPQCTVAMALYLFRALEKSGLYAYTDKCWDTWRKMLKDNMTTCVEEPVQQRSDCHAWGALALYELPSVALGVRPTKPGFADFEISPTPGHLIWAEGDVITPKGMVHVEWEKLGDEMQISWHKDW